MSELRELYQEMILDHGRSPRNFSFPSDANRSAEGFNPLCGDRITIKLKWKDGVIEDIGFQGSGCAISQAAASTMTEAVKGKTEAEALDLFEQFHSLVTRGEEAQPDREKLDKLIVFAGVAEYPMRVKCATLAWHTLKSALGESGEAATTE